MCPIVADNSQMRFEEQEFLPMLTKYAADIIRRGLLFEHRGILDSIAEVRESAREFIGKPTKREEMIAREANIHESIHRILELLEEHAHTQEVLFNLAREALAKQ